MSKETVADYFELGGDRKERTISRYENNSRVPSKESFNAILKKEEVNVNTYNTFEEAKLAIFEFIESWYNNKRIHSKIGYITPNHKRLIINKNISASQKEIGINLNINYTSFKFSCLKT